MIQKDINNKDKIWLWVLCIFIFGFILFINRTFFASTIGTIDDYFYNLMVDNIRSDTLTNIAGIFSGFSSLSVLLIMCILSFIFIKNDKINVCVLLNLIFVVVLNQWLKFIVQRPRPFGYNLITESGFSFPSGHSMVSVAFYGFLIYLIWKMVKKKKVKYILSSIITLLIIGIALSRVYLGVHYGTDIIGGAIISVLYLIVFIKLINKYFLRKEDYNMKNKKLINSFKYAFMGISSVFKKERNMKIHVLITCLVIIFGIVFNISVEEWKTCIICFGLVISLEIVNTSVEATVDICMPKKNPKAKLAKDTAAGAVLVMAVVAVVEGLIIFLPKIIELF